MMVREVDLFHLVLLASNIFIVFVLVLTIGITTVMYIFNSHILSVDIAVMSGQLEQQYKVDLKLNITLVSQGLCLLYT